MTNRETPAPTRRCLLSRFGTALGVAALAGCTSIDTASDDGRREENDPAGSDTPDNDPESGNATDDSKSDTTDGGGGGGGTDNGSNRSDGGETNGGCAGESVHEGYEETTVEVVSPEGELLGSVTAAVADTNSTRYLGLSDTDCLPPDRGMLFVYQEPQPLTFVMRDMDFGIDIVHIDENGVVTSIQHADPPGEGESGEEPKHQYPGTGQFVLEVNYDWTTEHGVETGDVVEFDPGTPISRF